RTLPQALQKLFTSNYIGIKAALYAHWTVIQRPPIRIEIEGPAVPSIAVHAEDHSFTVAWANELLQQVLVVRIAVCDLDTQVGVRTVGFWCRMLSH
ncbi:hypothetical protein, partial [Pseudomonas viridiflava]|uniref:hypothetical protein n=1 Tax=Pseudomonas viridiflava TaxID=33069 RepID=UPI00197DB384